MPMVKPERPSLPSSSTDFALPSLQGYGSPNSPLGDIPISPFLMLRGARGPSTLNARMHSPLAMSFAARSGGPGDESESDREAGPSRMNMDSPTPPSGGSQDNTPPPQVNPLGPPADVDRSIVRTRRRGSSRAANGNRSRSPSTPPRPDSDFVPRPMRRLSFPVKPPRILTLLQESRPDENELKSEANFQRLLATTSNQLVPGGGSYFSPKAPSDRGRYPEEADTEEAQRESTPSDEEFDEEPYQFGMGMIAISKPSTPAASVNGEEFYSTVMESPGLPSMDIDMLGSPIMAAATTSAWRHTPPPTASVVRSNKRKLTDADRFDPYPSNKRRAVSPSVSHLRHDHLRTPSHSRGPIALAIPHGAPGSVASSPIAGGFQYPPISRANLSMASPTLRSQMMLASPVMRPLSLRPNSVTQRREDEENEREISGAGSAVSGLTLS